MGIITSIVADDGVNHKSVNVSQLDTYIRDLFSRPPRTDLENIKSFAGSPNPANWVNDAASWRVRVLNGVAPIGVDVVKLKTATGADELHDVSLSCNSAQLPGFLLFTLSPPADLPNPLPAGSSVLFDICVHNQFGAAVESIKFIF